MIIRRSIGDKIFNVILYIVLTVLGLLFLYPMWHTLMGSFSDALSLAQHQGLVLWPEGFSLEGYNAVLSNQNIWKGYGNTILYVTTGTALSLFMTITGAYVISRTDFMLKKFLTIMLIITMYIGGGLIPFFLLVKALGMLDTIWAIIVPGCLSTWNLIVMRVAFRALPQSLEESACIDGANDFTILFRIIVPLSKATIMVMLLFYAVGQWNSWFNPMIFLDDRDKFPLALILRELLSTAAMTSGNSMGDAFANAVDIGSFNMLRDVIQYATIIVATVPILCIYPFVQRYFVTGVMMGSLKE